MQTTFCVNLWKYVYAYNVDSKHENLTQKSKFNYLFLERSYVFCIALNCAKYEKFGKLNVAGCKTPTRVIHLQTS